MQFSTVLFTAVLAFTSHTAASALPSHTNASAITSEGAFRAAESDIQVIDVLAPLSPVSIQSADATKNATATGGSQLRNWLVTEVITEEPSDDPGRAPWSVIKAEIKDPNSYDLGIGGNGRSVTSKARKHSVVRSHTSLHRPLSH
jgi:hypothetical protein